MLTKKNIPNLISLLRLFGIPLLLVLLFNDPVKNRVVTVALFLFLALTDFVDGFLARRWNAVSPIGALLDPLVDKLLVLSPLIAMIEIRDATHGYSWVPAWMVILLLAREFWITGLRGLAATENVILSATDLGKLKTCIQIIAVTLLLFHGENIIQIGDNWITTQYFGLQFLLISIVLSYWSGLEYTLSFFNGLSGQK
ncbi:CDP-diacylglycerol--glycerol-3-phosphate 3-phosphatidyltransferase [bacterium]|nr:CDP-diacylglycerol--glycerol-3-phosphate 3-phosphatidyltransferase [bacterium]